MTTGKAVLLAVLALATAGGLQAQFQMPLPPHATPDLAFQIDSRQCDSVRRNLGGIRGQLATKPRWTARVPGKSDSLPVSFASCRLWKNQIKGADSVRAIRKIWGGGGLDLLGDVASTFKSDQLFVQTSIVSGGIGPVYFKASYGQLFSSAESDDPAVTPDELRSRESDVLRLVQNGGSATGRVILPLLWGGGGASQQAIGAYVNAGVVGPLGETDSLRATLGMAAEGLISFAVRNLISYEIDADLYFGVRPGVQYVIGHDGILPGSSRALPFAQFAGGLRVGGQSRFGIFLTWVPEDFRSYVPDLQFTVQVPKL